jgi:uncharacterized lipoprotein YmbA
MTRKAGFKYVAFIVVTFIVVAAVTLAGCNSGKTKNEVSLGQARTAIVDSEKGSTQLWTENCMRCHNLRTQSSYSDTQWQVAMHHMRVRADLTAEEHRRILQYLQASN